MVVVHAGLKRSYREMRGYSPNPVSVPSSRDVSPLRTHREADSVPALRSGFDTPTHEWIAQPRTASFEPNSSVVLVGVRGVGKSSLGVIAATAYNRRLVDSERAFQDATGSTTQAFKKRQGSAEYLKRHRQVLERTLKTHEQDCVIICSFSDLEHDGAILLRDFATSHPVIHVTRDAKGIQSHLQVWSEERVEKLLRASGPILRSCSNFEYFNLTEKPTSPSGHDGYPLSDTKSTNGLFLTLKRVERDFLKLLRNIIGDDDRLPAHHSAYPLSQIRVEDRASTSTAVVDADEVYCGHVNLDELQIGVDAVELKVPPIPDWSASRTLESEAALLKTAEAYAMLRRATILPVIITAESEDTLTPDERYTVPLLNYCFRLAPEYCTVNLAHSDAQLSSFVSNKGRTAIIASHTFVNQPAAGWEGSICTSHCERADKLGCQLVKLTMPAQHMGDNFAVQAFRQKVEKQLEKVKLIAYNTGAQGRTSMCFNKILTPVKRPDLKATTAGYGNRDPHLTSKDIFTALFATFVYEPMHFFIYGANVSYSLSPAMHNAAYKACGMPHTYFTHSSPSLDDFKRLARDPHFGGAAVVQPYKTGVMPILDGLSSHARAIGSVNTIVPVRELDASGSIPSELVLLSQRNRSGPVKALYGQNTDWIGIRACLRRGLSPANTIRPQSTGLICGAGGQARSTIYSMLSLGVKNIFLANRTVENAYALADYYNKLIESHTIRELDAANAAGSRVRVIESFDKEWPNDFRYPSLIVSTIPTQSMDGSPTDFTLPETWLKSPTGGVAIELAYRPMNTPIVRQVNAQAHKGWIFMDGFDILPEQAFAQFELFTGHRAPRSLMRDAVINRHKDEQSRSHGDHNLDPNPPGS